MQSLRKFFGHLCGGSGRNARNAKGESPVDPPQENEEKEVEPSLILNDKIKDEHENKETVKGPPVQASSESLNESSSAKKKQPATHSVHSIYDVMHWKPEVLGVLETDKVFSDALEILEPFFKQSQDLVATLLSFTRQYSKDRKPNFKKCYQLYLKNKSGEKSSFLDDYSNVADIPDDKLQDPTVKQLKEIVVKSKALMELIVTIRPKVDNSIAEASKHDVKEIGKEKKDAATSPHRGVLSKFSAPGKFRRNSKHLKENRETLDSVYSEVESIFYTICKGKTKDSADFPTDEGELDMNQTGSQTLLSTEKDEEQTCFVEVHVTGPDEAAICDVTESPEVEEKHQNVPETEIDDVDVSKEAPVVHDSVEEVVNLEVVNLEVKLDESRDQTEIADVAPPETDRTEREQADLIQPLPSSPPLIPPLRKRSISFDNPDNHETKLLDYGSYIFVDPSANDEVLLRRSRSLDSLCSVTSRRTLSRYGSYEFVTDFEIKIAEKAEEQRQKMTESDAPSKKAKHKRTKEGKNTERHSVKTATTIHSESRGTSPIYKYTEVDYNPLAF